VRAPWSPGLVVVLAARLAAAAQPCPDEPGLDGIACRIDGLGVRAGAASSRLAAASTACDAGHTADAIRELRVRALGRDKLLHKLTVNGAKGMVIGTPVPKDQGLHVLVEIADGNHAGSCFEQVVTCRQPKRTQQVCR